MFGGNITESFRSVHGQVACPTTFEGTILRHWSTSEKAHKPELIGRSMCAGMVGSGPGMAILSVSFCTSFPDDLNGSGSSSKGDKKKQLTNCARREFGTPQTRSHVTWVLFKFVSVFVLVLDYFLTLCRTIFQGMYLPI